MPVHILRRNARRYAVSDFFEFPYLAYVDFETQTLGVADPANGWFNAGKVFTYAGGIAYEDFETSTLANNTPPGPDFGWVGGGVLGFGASISPSTGVADLGGTVSVSVTTTAVPGSTFICQWFQNGVALANGGEYSGVTTTTLTITGVTNVDYTTYTCAVTCLGSTTTTNAFTLVDRVTDWVSRVVTNGGASPSVGTVNAVRTFWSGCITDGLASSVIAMNVIAPDSLIAAITPLVKGIGLDPWTNTSFVLADLSVNGLTGNGSSKFLDTGVSMAALNNVSHALQVYGFSLLDGSGQCDLGANDGTNGIILFAKRTGSTFSYDGALGSNLITLGTSSGNGYYCCSRVSSTDHRIFFANSGSAHAQVGATDATAFSAAFSARNLYAFVQNASTGIGNYSTDTLSFISVTTGLSAGQSSSLFSRVQTLRTAFGGGYRNLNGTAMAAQWAARVVTNGGAAPSAGTKTALATFWDGLISDGIDGKMISINAMVPDNLIASTTPFLVGAGLDPWTNTSFVAGDLTVNGLKGNGSSKALNSGIVPSTAFSANNAGLVIYASAVTNATSTDFGAFTLGGGSGDTSVLIAADQGGTSLGELAEVFTIRPNTPTKGAGFYSVQRTGASSCVLYFANSGNAHASVATNTNTNSSAFIAVPMFVFDVNWTGGHQFSPNQLSFVAATLGLSSPQDSALFSRVQTLRTSLGGGFV